MKRKLLITMAVVALLVACQERYTQVPMQVEVCSQVEFVGNKTNIVRLDTALLVIVRDSVADEKTDTVYNLTTSLTFILDSVFVADKMEGALRLQINDIAFFPTDSALAEKLIAFLNSDTGTKTTIFFSGKAERSKFLQLSNVANVSLTGFSFHELDAEAMADPQITKLLDEYEKWGNNVVKEFKEYGMAGTTETTFLSDATVDLEKKKGQMTPKQLERYKKLFNRFKDYL